MSIFKKLVEFLDAREERIAKRRAIRRRADADYKSFLDESSEAAPFAPKNPEAALFRHAWRRAEVLRQISSRDSSAQMKELAERYARFAKRAGKDYDRVAPSNAYGKVRLELSAKQGNAIWAKELERINPKPRSASQVTACVYKGICGKTGRIYVGQTIGAPEHRWAQHRREQTGPFKKGAINPSYEILEIPVEVERLDEREAYFIGYYDSYENGLNQTSGNDRRAYERGCVERPTL